MGNIYNTEVETPRLDGISGTVLISNKKNGYNVMPKSESGLFLNGNIKDIEIIFTKVNKILIATQNQGPTLENVIIDADL